MLEILFCLQFPLQVYTSNKIVFIAYSLVRVSTHISFNMKWRCFFFVFLRGRDLVLYDFNLANVCKIKAAMYHSHQIWEKNVDRKDKIFYFFPQWIHTCISCTCTCKLRKTICKFREKKRRRKWLIIEFELHLINVSHHNLLMLLLVVNDTCVIYLQNGG